MGFFVVVVLNIPRESKRRSECTTRSAKFLDSSFKPDSFWTSGMACNDPAANLDGWKGNVNRVQSSHESQTNYFPTSSVPWYCLYSKLLISYFHVSFFFPFPPFAGARSFHVAFMMWLREVTVGPQWFLGMPHFQLQAASEDCCKVRLSWLACTKPLVLGTQRRHF